MVAIDTRKTYVARCERDGDWWVVDVEGVHGAFTQAKRLDQVAAMARDVVALMLEIPENSFDIQVEPVLPKDLLPGVNKVIRLREEAANVRSRAHDAASAAVADLSARNLPIRDIGMILGISHQRVSQLLRAHSARTGRSVQSKPVAKSLR